MNDIMINIHHYRESLEFSLISTSKSSLFEIEFLQLKVIKAYPCNTSGINIEGLLIPNSFEILMIPDYDIYDLYPLVKEHNSSWILKGTDIEKFSLKLKLLPLTALWINIVVGYKNLVTNKSNKMETESIFIEKNGEKAIKERQYEYLPKRLSEEFSINLYKVLISINYHFFDVLSFDEQNLIFNEIMILLEINKEEVENYKDYTIFDFKYNPVLVGFLFKIIKLFNEKSNISNLSKFGQKIIYIINGDVYGVVHNEGEVKQEYK